jgi:uncharacterized DUF497 family protein
MVRIEQWDGFEWDEGNSTKSWFKHKVTIEECEQVFSNGPLLIVPDTKHSELEERQIAFGITDKARPLAIAFTMRGTRIRPISARKMTRKERRDYAKESD